MLKVTAYAKFDLAIHINPKKFKDGYFSVHYIDCQINIFDKISFKKQQSKIEIICDSLKLKKGSDNFVYKAAMLLKEIAGNEELGAKITLAKNIPIKAGFGGGSSDAAATVLGLSRLWKIKLDENQIKELANELGKDFYYSLYGKLSEVVGKGKNYKVNTLSSHLPKFWLLVVVPKDEKPSTGWVYEHLRVKNIGRNFDKIEKLKAAILKGDKIRVLKNLSNDFEESVSSYYPVVFKIKDSLAKLGAQASIMAGSGLSVVGFFDSRIKAEKAKSVLKDMSGLKQVLVARPIN